MKESSLVDKKALITVTKQNPDWGELAKDCVCFANACGGKLLIGINNEDELPPRIQRIPPHLPEKVRRQIQNRTINVSVLSSVKTANNGGEYIEIIIQRSASSVASTSNGRYYIRVDDECKPVLPDNLLHLMNDRTAFVWETTISQKISRKEYDPDKMLQFLDDINQSDRISEFVKQKNPDEILDYYLFTSGEYLTNLGVLWIGQRQHRARLLYAPCIQFIKYDENDQKTAKRVWDDYSLNPKELILDVWSSIPDWKEGIEIADGIFRKNIMHYDEIVVRELLTNALIHRPYTTRGDIFINLYPDKFEIHNPGLFPLGITPENILHKSIQRNPHLAKVFYDLKLMEREGSGYDKIYESLLSQGKPLPIPKESHDRVVVTVLKHIVNKQVVQFIENVCAEFQLRSKELISLGLIAQNNALTAIEFAKTLGLYANEVQAWMGRLVEFELVKTRGKTKGMTYFVDPALLRKHRFRGKTNLRRIEPHRLKQLLIEDLERYGKSSISEIHQRIGKEIPIRTLRYQINQMKNNEISYEGDKKGRRYFINKT